MCPPRQSIAAQPCVTCILHIYSKLLSAAVPASRYYRIDGIRCHILVVLVLRHPEEGSLRALIQGATHPIATGLKQDLETTAFTLCIDQSQHLACGFQS